MKSRVRNLVLQMEPWYDYELVVEKGDNVMQIQLPPELLPFVEQEYATVRYRTREEVVVQALRWFREERQEAVAGIKQGLDDVAAGRTQPLAEAFADIRKEFGVPETEYSVVVTQKAKDDLRHYYTVARTNGWGCRAISGRGRNGA